MDSILITAVIVESDRFREGLGSGKDAAQAFEELKASIEHNGLLTPITVDDDGRLIAGYRRLKACEALGHKSIPCFLRDNLTELQRKEMELEENIRRHAMTFLEEQRAIVELDRLRQLTNPNWTQTQTAAVLGMSRSQVSKAQTIVKGAERDPEIAKAGNADRAYKILIEKAKGVMRKVEVRNNIQAYADLEKDFHLGDSVEWIKILPDGFIDAIITDPPFGIDFDEYSSSLLSQASSYKDTELLYRRILGMAPDFYRTLKENGWLVFFLGMSWYEEAKRTFRAAGFTVDEIPLIWDRSEGPTFTTNPEQLFSKGYDIALHCYKGKPVVAKRRSNVFHVRPTRTTEKELLVERPVELYKEIIEALTIPGELVADFFAGSGSCPVAALLSRRRFLAGEINEERRAVALKKLQLNHPNG